MAPPQGPPWHPFRHPGFCGLRGTVCFLLTLTVLIVIPLLWLEAQHASQNTKTPSSSNNGTNVAKLRPRRSTPAHKTKDVWVMQEVQHVDIESIKSRNAWYLYAKPEMKLLEDLRQRSQC